MSRSVLPWAVVCVIASLSGTAAAQNNERAVAEALFRAGREALSKGDHATACRRFEESNRLEPAVGTVFNLANCREKLGQLASAWQRYQEAVQKLPSGDERAGIASQRAAALEPRIPRLTLSLPEDAPDGTTILKDGVELGSGSLGVALPIDPGEHVLVVRSPQREDNKLTVTLAESETRTLTLELGAPLATALPESRDGTPTGSVVTEPATDAPASRGNGQRTLGFVLGGVGGAGVVVSLVTGALVLSKKSSVEDNCVDKRCTPEGLDAGDSGKTLSTVSTVSFIAGMGLLGTGIALVLTSNPETGAETALAPVTVHGGGGLRFAGSF